MARTVNGFVDVPAAQSTPITAGAGLRSRLVLTNDSDTVVYLALNGTAAANSGIRLNANGDRLILDQHTGTVAAFHSGTGNKRILIADV